MNRSEHTYGGGTHRVVTITESDPWAESARFLALDRESERLLDLAIDATDPRDELRLMREARKLRSLMAPR